MYSRGNSPGNAKVSGACPDDVDGDVMDPVGGGGSGDRPLGLLTEGDVRPLASHGRPIGSVVRDAPSVAVPGADDVLGIGPDVIVATDAVKGAIRLGLDNVVGVNAASVHDGASGDCTPGFLAEGGNRPPASPGGPNCLADGSDAPLTIVLDVSPEADGHRPTEENVGAANAGSLGTNATLTRQSTSLYPLFTQS